MKNSFLLLLLIAIIYSCNNSKNKQIDLSQTNSKTTELVDTNEGLKLVQTYCYACHNPQAKSHDEIIAPPLVAVKRRYSMQYNRDEFIEAITEWVPNPTEENALMKGAVNQFKVMPKLELNKNDLLKIATYLYDNDLEEPIWFDNHFKEQHPNGLIGSGRGKGRNR